MQREIRRKDRVMPNDEALKILDGFEYGVLTTFDPDWPYAVPISYVVMDENIYLHCAREGRKLDNIRRDSRVCFLVAGNTEPVYENNFSTTYQSIMVFGRAEEISLLDEKTRALMALASKYLPEHIDKAPADIARLLDVTVVVKIAIEHVTAKEKK